MIASSPNTAILSSRRDKGIRTFARSKCTEAFAIDFPGKVREIATNVAFSPAFSTVDVRQDAVVCRAFWETGANGSVISTKVVSALDLKPINKSEVFTANCSYVAYVYVVDVMLPNRFVIP